MSETNYSTVPGAETKTIQTTEQRSITRSITRQGLHGPEQVEETEEIHTERIETITPMLVVDVQSARLRPALGSMEISIDLAKVCEGRGSFALGGVDEVYAEMDAKRGY